MIYEQSYRGLTILSQLEDQIYDQFIFSENVTDKIDELDFYFFITLS